MAGKEENATQFAILSRYGQMHFMFLLSRT